MIFIAGEESGGNIAASVALRARDQIPDILSGQILLSPLLDPLMSTFSMRRAAEVGMREKWASGWSRYLAESGSVYHPYATPAYCSRLSGAPPSLFVSSTDDPLRDEGNQYAGRLSAAGVMVVKNVLATRSGWPTVYGGKTRRSPRWTAELRESVRAFLESLSTASQPNHDAVSA
jgi:acetyl esterase/lipase